MLRKNSLVLLLESKSTFISHSHPCHFIFAFKSNNRIFCNNSFYFTLEILHAVVFGYMFTIV